MSHRNPDGAVGLHPGGPLDLNQLRTFLAVHRAGSFTAAAHVLGVSQPTVTAQMRALERQLGRQLFERLPRGVATTAMADQLAAQIAGPLDALTVVAGGGDGASADTPAEPVHLAGPAELLCTRALPSLALLVSDGLRLRITTGLADDLLGGLRAGQFDLAVSTVRPRGRALTAAPLADEEFVLVAAPVWAERIGPGRVESSGPAALCDVPHITYAEDLPIARRYWRHVFGTRLNGPAAVVIPDLRGVLAAVVAGAGFAVLPRYLCLDELATGAVVPLLEPADPPINTGFLAWRAGAADNPHVTMVRDHLLQAGRSW
ncbi:LysR family transcriptional regulator [Actinomadura rudentiformis]|uniref:LysR family transcriptional regulator n=1 Tax=Actinomadura rudentiformis TaxID=359158 RepID=A0A6H9YWI6_9ACTN|nr:LysR family transcriptional regulator [Actinomadura rudentiformis]KAB2344426.1 LysR family transcriptional regulator [Actinomadura rudentiformis]